MSTKLSTAPKTNFESDDGATFSDLNEIGQNLIDLDDAVQVNETSIIDGDAALEASKQDNVTGLISGVTALNQKLVTGTLTGTTLSITHGLTAGNIRGVAISPVTDVPMTDYVIDSNTIDMSFPGGSSGTVWITIFYV